MKKSLALLVVITATLALAGCSSEPDGPTGDTVRDPIPLSQFFDETLRVEFDGGVDLLCYGTQADSDSAAYVCDWDSLETPQKLALVEGSEYDFAYVSISNEIVPCLFYRLGETDGWSSCGFGEVKL